jgi:hypothetical protein
MSVALLKTNNLVFNTCLKVLVGFFIFISTHAQVTTLEDFENKNGWNFIKSDGVNLSLSNEQGLTGNAMRFDYDFTKGTGYGGFQKEYKHRFA